MPENSVGDLEVFFRMSNDMLCIADTSGYFRRVNPSFERKLGYTQHELLSKPFYHFIHPDDRDATMKELDRLTSGIQTICFENRYMRKDQSTVWLSWDCPAPTEDGLLYAIARDVTEQRAIQMRLEDMAHRDSLTGLNNRAAFINELNLVMAQFRRHDIPFALLYLDLDGFKAINDKYGHGIGDQVLQEIALRFSRCSRESDMVARIGGDEFAIILQAEPLEPEQMGVRMLAELEADILVAEKVFRLGASIGIVHSTQKIHCVDKMIRCADFAMYTAKREGGSRVSRYQLSAVE
ncbi:sensor domain-containing diguanylate cyclase [Porticoccaceae bacterium LTM1]|nr:sensor domain-containing diguanylate cyclase [Porticoccaceae bacterium LTM1]